MNTLPELATIRCRRPCGNANHQRAGKTMLAVDDGQPIVVVHQFVDRSVTLAVRVSGGTFLVIARDHAATQ
jgi:hypothetical protein